MIAISMSRAPFLFCRRAQMRTQILMDRKKDGWLTLGGRSEKHDARRRQGNLNERTGSNERESKERKVGAQGIVLKHARESRSAG